MTIKNIFKKAPTKTSSDLHGILKNSVQAASAMVEVSIAGSQVNNTAQQLKSVTETAAAASNEMSATVSLIAENAGYASDNIQAVSESAQQNVIDMESVEGLMSQAAKRITELESSSREIGEIVTAIDDIADQTNLLALNAAIEAARAGDAGRGFAVVADEVKKLSQRSQEATAKISQMLNFVQKSIEASAELVKNAHHSVHKTTETTKTVHNTLSETARMIGDIASSTGEQRIASEDISNSVTEVLDVARLNENNARNIIQLMDVLSMAIEEQRARLAEKNITDKVILLAQADHLLWKKKLVDFESGRIQLKPEDAGDHTICRLGKWYYEQGITDFKENESFKAIEEPHRKVHAIAKRAILKRQEDPKADIMPEISELEQASAEVVSHLQALENNLK